MSSPTEVKQYGNLDERDVHALYTRIHEARSSSTASPSSSVRGSSGVALGLAEPLQMPTVSQGGLVFKGSSVWMLPLLRIVPLSLAPFLLSCAVLSRW